MADDQEPVQALWESVRGALRNDDRITPQLEGFLALVEPKGVMAGTLYLEVPNDLTRGMLEQRIRIPLLNAISLVTADSEPVSNFAVVVNPEVSPDFLDPAPEPV